MFLKQSESRLQPVCSWWKKGGFPFRLLVELCVLMRGSAAKAVPVVPHRIRTGPGVKISDIRVSDADQWGVQEETDSARSTATLTCVHNEPGAEDRWALPAGTCVCAAATHTQQLLPWATLFPWASWRWSHESFFLSCSTSELLGVNYWIKLEAAPQS